VGEQPLRPVGGREGGWVGVARAPARSRPVPPRLAGSGEAGRAAAGGPASPPGWGGCWVTSGRGKEAREERVALPCCGSRSSASLPPAVGEASGIRGPSPSCAGTCGGSGCTATGNGRDKRQQSQLVSAARPKTNADEVALGQKGRSGAAE